MKVDRILVRIGWCGRNIVLEVIIVCAERVLLLLVVDASTLMTGYVVWSSL